MQNSAWGSLPEAQCRISSSFQFFRFPFWFILLKLIKNCLGKWMLIEANILKNVVELNTRPRLFFLCSAFEIFNDVRETVAPKQRIHLPFVFGQTVGSWLVPRLYLYLIYWLFSWQNPRPSPAHIAGSRTCCWICANNSENKDSAPHSIHNQDYKRSPLLSAMFEQLRTKMIQKCRNQHSS